MCQFTILVDYKQSYHQTFILLSTGDEGCGIHVFVTINLFKQKKCLLFLLCGERKPFTYALRLYLGVVVNFMIKRPEWPSTKSFCRICILALLLLKYWSTEVFGEYCFNARGRQTDISSPQQNLQCVRGEWVSADTTSCIYLNASQTLMAPKSEWPSKSDCKVSEDF